MPLLFSMISYFIYKKKDVNQEEDGKERREEKENEQEEPETYVIVENKWEFLWQIPVVSVIRNFVLLKELIRVKDEKDEVKVDSKIQNFRIFQSFCGSVPISILTIAHYVHDQEISSPVIVADETANSLLTDQLNQNSNPFDNESKISFIDSMSTIGLILARDIFHLIGPIVSYLTNITLIAETFIYIPVFLKTDLIRNKILHQTRKSYFFIIPSTTLIFTPRFLILTLLFSVWRGIGCFLTFVGAIAIYTLGFVLLIYTRYRGEWKENSKPLLQSYLTSFFTPCIIMYPESQLIFWTSLVSTLPHLFLISALLFMANHYSEELFPKLAPDGFYFLIPCILTAPVFSWLMHSYSQEKMQKILLSALSFKLVKFFLLSIVLCALDELTDILAAMDYFR